MNKELLKQALCTLNNLINSACITDPQPWRDARKDAAQCIAALEAAIAQPVSVAFWQPVKLSDVPNGVEEIYPEKHSYQFLAPRGDGSAQGNQGWLITLPSLPTEGV